jgi:hypothetical protein
VERIADSFSALLSKSEVARMIAAQEAPFENISFDGFGPTFKALSDLISDHERFG